MIFFFPEERLNGDARKEGEAMPIHIRIIIVAVLLPIVAILALGRRASLGHIVLVMVFLIGAAHLAFVDKVYLVHAVGSVMLLVAVMAMAVWLGIEIGRGLVILYPLFYSQQLREGKVYTLLADVEDGETSILLLRNEKDKLRIIRIIGPSPPPHFKLVCGKPDAVTITSGK